MRKKILAAITLAAALAGGGLLFLGFGPSAEACVSCVNGNCENGGDGIMCRETHWANGSSVCQYIDGCAP